VLTAGLVLYRTGADYWNMLPRAHQSYVRDAIVAIFHCSCYIPRFMLLLPMIIGGGYVIGAVCLFVCLSVRLSISRNQLISLKLVVMIACQFEQPVDHWR